MAVEDILNRIGADAEEAARRIVAEGRAAADAVMNEARARAEAEKKSLLARAEQRAREERNRITTLARLNARRELLGVKQGLIDRVFEEAAARLADMEKDEYRKFISSLLADVVESGDEEVIVGEGEARIDQDYLDRFSRDLGRGSGLRLAAERRPIPGGFVLRNGRVETNCGLDTIIRDAREKLETEVAAILFARGDSSSDGRSGE